MQPVINLISVATTWMLMNVFWYLFVGCACDDDGDEDEDEDDYNDDEVLQ